MYKLYKNKKKYKFKESFDFFSYPLILNNVEVSSVDERIIKIFINSNINFDFSKLASKVIIFLDDDSAAEDGALLLSELNNLSNMIFNLYADYFTKNELNYYMRNIRLLVQEIKKRIILKEQAMENSMRSRRSR